MKEILPINAREYPKITDIGQRQFLEMGVAIMAQYTTVGYFAYKYIGENQDYINMLFERVDSFYEVYELEKKYFESLGTAATNLERLYNEKLTTLTATAVIDQTKMELAGYLDKVTMIFQTAADKTEDKEIRNFCTVKAKQYSDKADQICGRIFPMNYTAKLQALYESAAAACGFDFIRELLQARADEYKQKHTEEVAKAHEDIPRFWSSASAKKSELQPLLVGSESQDGLRRRTSTTTRVPS